MGAPYVSVLCVGLQSDILFLLKEYNAKKDTIICPNLVPSLLMTYFKSQLLEIIKSNAYRGQTGNMNE